MKQIAYWLAGQWWLPIPLAFLNHWLFDNLLWRGHAELMVAQTYSGVVLVLFLGYVANVNQSSGKTFRLLSEAEREYAARSGSATAFWWGDSINTDQAKYNGTVIFCNNSPKGVYRQATVAVSSFRSNPFGLYNAHGNVWEWVQDYWHSNYSGAPTDGSAWTSGQCQLRVPRSGRQRFLNLQIGLNL